VTYLFSKSQLSDAEALLNGPKDNYKYASNKAEAEQLFGMNIPDTSLVIREFKEYSGTLNPKALIKKLHLGIRMSGNRVNYNQKVNSLKKEYGIYEIRIIDTKTGTSKTILSKMVVAAAGPYNGTLVKDVAPYFSSLINPKRLFLSFLKIKSDKYDLLTYEQQDRLNASYPVAYLNSEIFYSMIEKHDENNRPLLKIGGHFLRTEIEDLDAVWKKELTADEILWSKKYTADYLNKLNLSIELSDLEYDKGYSCVYSLTESEIPYVCYIIDNKKEVDSSFVLIGGMSGIGAKGSLAYGLIAADLVYGNENKSFMYQKAKMALGAKRLIEDIQNIDK
jgi:glycine/D-amino acid oxidase-like deaminating enzyme